MDNFRIDIGTSNAAFKDDPGELARLLRKVADRLDRGDKDGRIVDINGNVVGRFDHLENIE